MPATSPDALYRLLPAIHRIRDGGQGEPLRALLSIIQGEFDRLDADIAGLYDNWFIETCDEWVVPYIGDLLRVRPLHPVEAARVTTRAYVANTLAYRRRKGTAVVLEQLARDTTGYPAHAVEFFARLITTQHMNHVRLSPAATPEIRDAEAAELTGSPFDRFGHTLDVRRIAAGRGMHNIPNIGIFLWRLQSYAIGRPDREGAPTDFATARERPFGPPAIPQGVCYTFHPAGVDAPLFNDPQTEEAITHLAEEQNVPGPLRRLALGEELEALRRAAEASPPEQAQGLRFMAPEAPALRVFLQHAPGSPRVEVPPESDVRLRDSRRHRERLAADRGDRHRSRARTASSSARGGRARRVRHLQLRLPGRPRRRIVRSDRFDRSHLRASALAARCLASAGSGRLDRSCRRCAPRSTNGISSRTAAPA